MFLSGAAVCSPKTAVGTSCYPSSATKHCTQWIWDGHLLFFNSFVSSPPGNGLSAQISDACCSFPFCLWWSCPCNCLCQQARGASRSQLQQEDMKANPCFSSSILEYPRRAHSCSVFSQYCDSLSFHSKETELAPASAACDANYSWNSTCCCLLKYVAISSKKLQWWFSLLRLRNHAWPHYERKLILIGFLCVCVWLWYCK